MNGVKKLQLIIAEKPSVARSIADVLGASDRHEGFLQGRNHIVTWCVGHLVELAMPEAYDRKYEKWRYEDLPIFPEEWQFIVSEGTRKQFNVLKALMHDSKVTEVVCATDAGREGELIFRLAYQKAECKLPVKRLWISSMEPDAIRDGFAHLKDGKEYDDLYKAALCRACADWLVGMNATRLYSLLYGQTLHVGRVMTPTLAMIVDREESIQTFHPEQFFTVQLDAGFIAQSERFKDRETAEKLCSLCDRTAAIIQQIDRKSRSEQPPKLYDLTSLQRDANKLLGFTAQQTLDYTQSLYEHQLVTYPRTDSNYLTHDMENAIPGLVQKVADSLPFAKGLEIPVQSAQMINDKKVSDHHAIIPTATMTKNPAVLTQLTTGERDILNLICVRLLCAAGKPFLYDETTVTLNCAGHIFTAKGKHIHQMGWKAQWYTFRGSLGGRTADDEKAEPEMPADLVEGAEISSVKASVHEGKTAPPAHFTEGTVLTAMENAGSEDMPEDAERKGIGTPATRAATLEKLIGTGLVERKGSGKTKSLVPTDKGSALAAVLPEQLMSPQMTADWEQRLKRIEQGQDDPGDFITDIESMLTSLIETANRIPNAEEIFPSDKKVLGTCPECGAPVTENSKGFFCGNRVCGFALWKNNAFLKSGGKTLTADMVQDILQNGYTVAKGLKSRNGKTYSAMLMLEQDDNNKPRLRAVFN